MDDAFDAEAAIAQELCRLGSQPLPFHTGMGPPATPGPPKENKADATPPGTPDVNSEGTVGQEYIIPVSSSNRLFRDAALRSEKQLVWNARGELACCALAGSPYIVRNKDTYLLRYAGDIPTPICQQYLSCA